ncbi:hypothetical protein, partial [Corynebacterium belfantii]|uniref:hypothetical protein n=1 Tax=Corynebacterium belfantii TaxID=2014537 RepID=UPI001FD38AA4
AVFHETDHTVFGILVKFPWHVPDFPIYSNGTKPGTLHVNSAVIRLPHMFFLTVGSAVSHRP